MNFEPFKNGVAHSYEVVKPKFKQLVTAAKAWVRAHKVPHIEIRIKITLVRVVVGALLLWNVWPHSTAVHAAPDVVEGWSPVKMHHIKPAEPISAHFKAQSKLSPIELPKPVTTPPVQAAPAVVSGCGDNSYARFIYTHESGCNLRAQNSIGCLGIGQACPGSKLAAACPSLDYACENAYFSAYAISAYGGWSQAYQFWLANSWW